MQLGDWLGKLQWMASLKICAHSRESLATVNSLTCTAPKALWERLSGSQHASGCLLMFLLLLERHSCRRLAVILAVTIIFKSQVQHIKIFARTVVKSCKFWPKAFDLFAGPPLIRKPFELALEYEIAEAWFSSDSSSWLYTDAYMGLEISFTCSWIIRHSYFTWQVMDLVELTVIKDSLVGKPGISGLSVEQRKRLTIAVELVANPSIIMMDVRLYLNTKYLQQQGFVQMSKHSAFIFALHRIYDANPIWMELALFLAESSFEGCKLNLHELVMASLRILWAIKYSQATLYPRALISNLKFLLYRSQPLVWMQERLPL